MTMWSARLESFADKAGDVAIADAVDDAAGVGHAGEPKSGKVLADRGTGAAARFGEGGAVDFVIGG